MMDEIQRHVADFSVSQGECVAKALLKVWGRVQKLHQQQQLTTPQQNKESIATQTEHQKSENETRCKLLELQLRYIRKAVHDTHISCIQNSLHPRKSHPLVELKNLEDESKLHKKHIKIDVGCADVNERKDVCSNKLHSSQTFPKFQATSLETEEKYINQLSLPLKESPNHYHLKLDDIPFILGTSTSASHSLIANVQNLISMMKSHKKSLCNSANPVNKGCKSSKCASGKGQKMDKDHHLILTKEELNVILQTLENELEILKKKEHSLLNRQSEENNADEETIENKISHISHIYSLLSKLIPSVNNPTQRTVTSSAVARNKERIAENRKFLHEVQKAKYVLQQDICWK